MKKVIISLAITLIYLAGFAQQQAPPKLPPFQFPINLTEEAYLTIREGLGKLPAEKSMDLIAAIDNVYRQYADEYRRKIQALNTPAPDSSSKSPVKKDLPKKEGKN